jgi:lipopolysaccharide biosynthesis regulator YciM
MGDYTLLLATLVALLAGLIVGKAWERYKLRNGHLVDRRKLRESPHYLQGLNFLISSQTDLAIEELSKAAAAHADASEVHIVLGNLYREKGQVGRAIQVHQQLLQHPRLTRLEQSSVLLCLGLDYKQGGFVDRAIEAFNEVLRLDPANAQALANLEKLFEDQHQWQAAYDIRSRMLQAAPDGSRARHRRVLAFLENELGREANAREDHDEAARRFQAAVELDPAVVPAWLNLGDVRLQRGNLVAAVAAWERLIEVAPERVHLAFDRLASAYARSGSSDRFVALCRRLIADRPHDWRARVALARHLTRERRPQEAMGLVHEALAINPHSILLHDTAWKALAAMGLPAEEVSRYFTTARESVFYQDPHVCVRCRYRSTELLWQCPHCHDWNSFVEERLTAVRDEDALVEPTRVGLKE